MPDTCSGPGCDRVAVALGLCGAHYRQQARDRQQNRARPLRQLQAGDLHQLPGIRVREVAYQVLVDTAESAGQSLGHWVRSILEEWATAEAGKKKSAGGT